MQTVSKGKLLIYSADSNQTFLSLKLLVVALQSATENNQILLLINRLIKQRSLSTSSYLQCHKFQYYEESPVSCVETSGTYPVKIAPVFRQSKKGYYENLW